MSRQIAVLTGAGISTAAGVPDFRGPQGVWTLHPEQMSVYDLDLFLTDQAAREYSWRWQKESPVWGARPGQAHRALARLEQAGALAVLATQNFDALHTAAGNAPDKVVELHGSIGTSQCLRCGAGYDTAEVMDRLDEEPDPRCHRPSRTGLGECRGILKTDVTYFGEALPSGAMERAEHGLETADELWVIGSTLEVYPAASLVPLALARGLELTIVNLGATAWDSEASRLVREDIEEAVPMLVEEALSARSNRADHSERRRCSPPPVPRLPRS